MKKQRNIVMPEAYAKATSSDECTLDIVSRPEIDVVPDGKRKKLSSLQQLLL